MGPGVAKTPLRLAQNGTGGALESPKPLCSSHRMALEGPWNLQNPFAPRTEWPWGGLWNYQNPFAPRTELLWRGPGIFKPPLRVAKNHPAWPKHSLWMVRLWSILVPGGLEGLIFEKNCQKNPQHKNPQHPAHVGPSRYCSRQNPFVPRREPWAHVGSGKSPTVGCYCSAWL